MRSNFPPGRNKALDLKALKPVLRAYALGYVTTTGPRIISFVRILQRKDLSYQDKVRYLVRVLGGALKWNRFPAFCAFVAGGASVIPILAESICNFVLRWRRSTTGSVKLSLRSVRLLRFTATLISAFICFPILNSKRRPESQPNELRKTNGDVQGSLQADEPVSGQLHHPSNRPEFAGRTLDLTLFAATRAVDALVNITWARWKESRNPHGGNSRFQTILPQLADSGVFAASAGIVMWAWFYLPDRLPHSYGRWIKEAAEVDERIIDALRGARWGEWTYGQDKGSQKVLEPMCEDYGWPTIWGDTSKTVPIPCEIVHMGFSPNCEKHAIWRFAKAFKFAFSTYLPLQLITRGRSGSTEAILNAIKSSIRSSTFLGLFVSLFYYSVCLARTRLGPKLISAKRITPMMWDSGLCVLAGCIMCGWSILVETPQRRPEFALFVAPRAAATLFPRRYDRKHLWKENIAFSLSTAIVFTSVQENPKLVRGVLGKLLTTVFQQ